MHQQMGKDTNSQLVDVDSWIVGRHLSMETKLFRFYLLSILYGSEACGFTLYEVQKIIKTWVQNDGRISIDLTADGCKNV